MNKYKKIFKEVYSDLGKFSLPYTVDIKRFCYSLKLLDCNGLIEGKCILDLGSGVGIMAIAFSRLGARVTGIDKFIFPSVGENPYRVSDFKKLEEIWRLYKSGARTAARSAAQEWHGYPAHHP